MTTDKRERDGERQGRAGKLRKIILDTNFIMTCVKEKIDLFEKTGELGAKIIIPEKVIEELERIGKSNQKLKSRRISGLALKIIESEKGNYETISLKTRNVDNGIKKLADADKGVIVATLDAELKRKLKCPKLVIRAGKKLEIV